MARVRGRRSWTRRPVEPNASGSSSRSIGGPGQSGAPDVGGAGLGLSIARGIAEAQGGGLTSRSAQGAAAFSSFACRRFRPRRSSSFPNLNEKRRHSSRGLYAHCRQLIVRGIACPSMPTPLTRLKRVLFGRPLASDRLDHERLNKKTALAVLSSDAISSVAYATEQTLIVLAVLGTAALSYVVPISAVIVGLLVLVALSYRQTIFAYPGGGGSYTVAKDNLGTDARSRRRGGVADRLHPHRLGVDLGRHGGDHVRVSASRCRTPCRCASRPWSLLMLVNLRGVRESGIAFSVPTYVFIVIMLALIGVGLYRVLSWRRRSRRRASPAPAAGTSPLVGFALTFLILRAFAEGCVAMTGNRGDLERRRRVQVAELAECRDHARLDGGDSRRRSSSARASWLVTTPSCRRRPRRCSRSSGATSSAAERSTTSCSTRRSPSSCSRRTPRSPISRGCRAFWPATATCRGSSRRAATDWRSRTASSRSRVVAALLIWLFHGDTSALIPLYAIGVFVCFTLSQAGMVVHWWRSRDAGWQRRAALNGLGAVATAVVSVVQVVTKFTHGAWIVVLDHSADHRRAATHSPALRALRRAKSRTTGSRR